MARLRGLAEIAAYEKKSIKTVRKLIRHKNYPAIRLGGDYESDTGLIDKWRKLQIVTETGFMPEGTPWP